MKCYSQFPSFHTSSTIHSQHQPNSLSNHLTNSNSSASTMSIPSLKLYHKEPYPAISPSLPALSQAGKTVVVSGASSGIGLAIARSFVAAGSARVFLLGRRRETVENAAATLNQESGRNVAEGVSVDAFDVQAIEAFWAGLHTDGIYVDVLVLSSSAYGNVKTILESSFEDTWRDFESNVRAPLAMTLQFSKQTTGTGKKVSTKS